jgi:hypothetical protein
MASDMTIILMMVRVERESESNFRLFSSARSFIIAWLLFYHFSRSARAALSSYFHAQGQEGKYSLTEMNYAEQMTTTHHSRQ